MPLITDSAMLADVCEALAQEPFVTIDTEFIRERSYYPQLCLVQVAGQNMVKAIDPLAAGIDLQPLFDLLSNESVLKVFHAASQDLEIFYHLMGKIPHPIFDTQVAAMVCGYGESIGYERLVASICKKSLDKSSRFTDWAARPLSERQIDYALSDVTHLRDIYGHLQRKLHDNGRENWIAEEMEWLTDPARYAVDVENAWQRMKPKVRHRRFLGVLREVARWREERAMARDMPRRWLLKDETALEIAASMPESAEALRKARGIGSLRKEEVDGLLQAIEAGKALPEAECPTLPSRPEQPEGSAAMNDMLRVLLKARCEQSGIAAKLVATADDLAAFVRGDHAKLHFLHGWRREVFGRDALQMLEGKLLVGYDPAKCDVVFVERDGLPSAA